MGLLETMRDCYCRPLQMQATRDSISDITTLGLPGTNNKALLCPPWLPETYQLDVPAEYIALLRSEENSKKVSGKDSLWIYKPSCSNR